MQFRETDVALMLSTCATLRMEPADKAPMQQVPNTTAPAQVQKEAHHALAI